MLLRRAAGGTRRGLLGAHRHAPGELADCPVLNSGALPVYVRAQVANRFGVELQPEPVAVGIAL